MEEDTSDKVIQDLENMDIDDLRLMARQNDLRYDGTKSNLLSRIKTHFGYPSHEGKISNLSGAASSSSSTAQPSTSASRATETAGTTRTASAEVPHGFVKDVVVGLEALKEMSHLKTKEPLLDPNLETGEASGKV